MSIRDTEHRAVAIVGIGAILPDAPDAATFWNNVKAGRYSINEVEADRWDPALYYDPDPKAPDKTYSKLGSWVRDWEWEPIKWKLPIPPKVAGAMDEAQRWAINCTRAALNDFGYPDRKLDADRTAVILGNAMAGEKHYMTSLRVYFPEFARELEHAPSFVELPPDVQQAIVAETHDRFKHLVPEITEDSMPGELGNCIAGRLANLFDFHGPNYVVDAACASAMAAMSAAAEGLEERDFDAVITGGIDRNMGASTYIKFSKIGALSATGSRPYAAGADGFVMGEGAVVFVLKRLADAKAAGDHIYAVLRGLGGSSDGKGKGITAPNPLGQKLAIQRGWENAGLPADTAGYIEGHGTSTRVGDVVELESLAEVFQRAGAVPGSIPVGSVKSNIGHLKGAAGAAGMLKAIMALHDKVLPPSINFDQPNPMVDFKHSPFWVNTELRDWDTPACGVRRAGASAFGFGGTNFHAVLEEYVPRGAGGAGRSSVSVGEVPFTSGGAGGAMAKAPLRGALVLGARETDELAGRLREVRTAAEASRVPRAAAPQRKDLDAHERIAIDYADPADLATKAGRALGALERNEPAVWKMLEAGGVFHGTGPAPKIVFLYTGQGSQYVNMLAELRRVEPIVAEVFDEADRVMKPLLGKPLSEFVFVDADDPAAVRAAERRLMQTAITQPAVLAADIALTRLLAEYGIEPDLVMGHSLGEYGALVASGGMAFGDALEAVSARGREMTAVSVGDNGKMAAVFAPLADVQRLLAAVDGYVVIANINSNAQAVIGGGSAAVDAAVELFTKSDIRAVPLTVSHAFHTSIVAPASDPLRQALERLSLRPTRIPCISNVTGDFYPTGPDAEAGMLDLLARQVASPVQFIKGLETLYGAGGRIFVEVGPKKALKGFVDDVLGARAGVLSLFTNHPKVGDIASFNQALCGAYATGYGATSAVKSVDAAIAATTANDADEASSPPAPTPTAIPRPTSVEAAPAAAPPSWSAAPQSAAGGDRYNELGRLFADFLERGREIVEGRVPGAAPAAERVFVTGAAVGLPGTAKIFDDDNLGRILAGEQMIDVVPYRLREAMAGKHITRLVKRTDGEPTFETIDAPADVIKLAGRGGAFDVVAEFGVKEDRAKAFDTTTSLAIAAGIDALRDAGIPLMLHYKPTSKGTWLPDRWRLPEALRDSTGVIFASAFPGYDAFARDLGSYHVERGRLEHLADLTALRQRLVDTGAAQAAVDEVDGRIGAVRDKLDREGFHFDRRFLFRILSMGHAQFAEEIGARGPNTQVNAACASTTQALGMANDWIRQGRCRRVIIVAADNATSDGMMEWIGAGFLASGAAAIDEDVTQAALPFDRRRHGMLIGMGAAALVVEAEDEARARGMQPICEVLGTAIANSAFHGTRLDVEHICQVMESLVAGVEGRFGLDRDEMAAQTVFVSHETYTPARGGSAAAEVHALRRVFGDKADSIVVANTKGFTGHPMGVGIEDVIAVKTLETGIVPPVPNFKEVDPDLGRLNLSRGGAYPVQYALRLAAGFGSQIGMTLLRWVPTADGRRRAPRELGHAYRVVDRAAWSSWLDGVSGLHAAETEVVQRRFRVRDQGPPRYAAVAAAATSVAASATPPPETQVQAPAPAPTTQVAVQAPQPAGDAVAARVLAIVSETTGYPSDMLDPELDLEADLGIDTVKQAEVFAAVRETFGIEREDNLQLRDFPTLDHVIRFAHERGAAAATAPSAAASAPAPAMSTVAATSGQGPSRNAEMDDRIIAIVAETTGYPADMLDPDLDLEADLGIDTVKQAEIFASVREAFGIPREDNLQLRDFPTLASVIRFAHDRAGQGTLDAAATLVPAPNPPAAPASAAPGAQEGEIAARLLDIVAATTGYPQDMLDLELDLEADLGIDTVKQAEIFASIRAAYGIPRDESLQLRDFPTLAHVIGFVRERLPAVEASAPGPAPTAATDATETVTATAPGPRGDMDAANAVPRRVPRPVWRPALEMCKATQVTFDEGARVVVMPDAGGVGTALVERLAKRGVETLVLDRAPSTKTLEEQLGAWIAEGRITGVYWLAALDGEPPLQTMELTDWREALRVRVKLLFATMRALGDRIGQPGTFLVAATRLGGQLGYDDNGALHPLGGATSGFVKAFKRERPEALCKVVDFAPSRKRAGLADRLIDETLRDPGAVEIGLKDDMRWTVGVEEIPTDGRPSGVELSANTSFLVTGAAGSIVSAIVADLATACDGGVFHLFDLAAAPDLADPELARFGTGSEGREELKRSIFERLKAAGERATPARVERELGRLERSHSALAAIQAIERAGGKALYQSVDLTDGAAVTAAVERARAVGAIDVLIHAAGLEISRFVPDKSPEEYDLVFDVKADGWFNILRALGDRPLRGAVAFSSVAGRFGNAGQTDYSAANDLLCKCVSSFRNTRPGTLGVAIDWTAWGDIGMATRGSIPKMMELAGIDMLPAAAGIPIVRRELTEGPSFCEVVIGLRLGVLLDEWDEAGGVDPAAFGEIVAGPMIGRVVRLGIHDGLTVETELDPGVQPFLNDHRIGGTAVLPGVMGIEGFAEMAALTLPGWHVAAIEDVRFMAPFKFYRDRSRTLRLTARYTTNEAATDGGILARCRLIGIRHLETNPEPQVTTHFEALVHLVPDPPQPVESAAGPMADGVDRPIVLSDDVYRVYFHGPAYRVLESAWSNGPGSVVGRMAQGLPENHSPQERPLALAPRHLELCLQTAGIHELGTKGRMGLPASIGRVSKFRDPAQAEGPLLSIVRRREHDEGYDADVVDPAGTVYLRLENYHTVELPGGADPKALRSIVNAVAGTNGDDS